MRDEPPQDMPVRRRNGNKHRCHATILSGDRLATAVYVTTDDLLEERPDLAPGRLTVGLAPQLTDAELITLAMMRAMLGFTSEAIWLRHTRAHLRQLFPYLPKQRGYNKRLRKVAELLRRVTRTLVSRHLDVDDDVISCYHRLARANGNDRADLCSSRCGKSSSRSTRLLSVSSTSNSTEGAHAVVSSPASCSEYSRRPSGPTQRPHRTKRSPFADFARSLPPWN